MTNTETIILLFVLVVLAIVFAFKELLTMLRPDRVVLVSSRIRHVEHPFLEAINTYAPQTENMNFVELGAGYAKICTLAARSFIWKSLIAVERDHLALSWARLKNRLNKLPITYIKSDIFTYSIPQESVIYCYMSEHVVNKLYNAKAFDHCLLLSLSFAIHGVEPVAKYDLKGFQKRLYVYDFR
ncbi:MAG: class I SAM-dependent methyltransferase [Bacteroidota bacterium]